MLPLEKAKYIARAVSMSWANAESSGNKQCAAHMQIEEGEHAGAGLAWFGHFTDKTADRTIESLQHMGWQGDDLFELHELDAEGCARLLPNLVEIVCEVEPDLDGVPRLKVRWINKIGGDRFKFKTPLEAHEMKAFAAQMRGTIRGAGGRVAASRPAQTAPAQRSLDHQRVPAQSRASQPHPNAPGSNRGGFGGPPPDDDGIPF
jgi:hypothetical protein